MKFDAARAMKIVEELGDARFAGPDWEARVADFVAQKFSEMSMQVERSEVAGSRFPQRFAPWFGWLGYGALITAVYVTLWQQSDLAVVLAIAVLFVGVRFLESVLINRIRLGRRRPPVEKAPLIVARPPGDLAPPVRVVFQAVLGELKTDLFHSVRPNPYFLMTILHACLLVSAMIAVIPRFATRPRLPSLGMWLATGFFAFIWIVILCILSWEHRQSRLMTGSHQVDRRALAVLLEMARSWQRNRQHPIEAIFVAAGGQRLDYAGSREVVRRLQSEWQSRPSLLVLLFAPGAGEELLIGAGAIKVGEIAVEAARSLWIPHQSDHVLTMYHFWPFEKWIGVAALMGSDPNAFSEASVHPEALHRAAQLATEIALRWAKKQREAPES
ncbi:MAG: hypothetical protein ACHRXM_22475 [Isosphaerales bacterium]